MSQIKEVNDQILTKISKNDEFYEALWGKEDFTPESTITLPNDYNCGALANPLEYVYQFVRDITEGELDDLEDPYIDVVVYFFTGIKRLPGESNAGLITRMESLIVREGEWRSERFGTPWDILNVFGYYLDRDLLHYIPNHVLTNILVNGDFEDAISGEWVFSPSGDRTSFEAFSGLYKVDFTDFNSVEQTVPVISGAYILNCFVKPLSGPPEGFASTWDSPANFDNASYTDQDFIFTSGGSAPTGELDVFNLSVQRDSDSFYYNFDTESWESSLMVNKFTMEGDQYTLAEFFVVNDGSYNITIKFEKIIDFLLDRVEFGVKLYPAYEILHIDSGLAEGFASTWAETFVSEFTSFLDQEYMFASASSALSDSFFQDILNQVKASGILGVYKSDTRIPTPDPPEPVSLSLSTSENELIETSDGFLIEILSL